MLSKASNDFKTLFLLEFTKQLIKHSGSGEVLLLEHILDQKSKKNLKSGKTYLLKEQSFNLPTPKQKTKILATIDKIKARPLDIKIDFGKLNQFLQNPLVKSIECDGPGEKILIKLPRGVKLTNITLSKEEIQQIINKFSDISKMPLHEGIFRVTVGNLNLSAIVSDVVGSKFIIRKIPYGTHKRLF